MIIEATSKSLMHGMTPENITALILCSDTTSGITAYDRSMKIISTLKYSVQNGYVGNFQNRAHYAYTTAVSLLAAIDTEIEVFSTMLDTSDPMIAPHIRELMTVKTKIETYLDILV